MALAANKVSPSVVVVILLLLLFLAAPFSVHARAAPLSVHARGMSYGKQIRSTSDDDDARQMEEVFFARFLHKAPPAPAVKYKAYQVMLRARPNGGGEAMDDDGGDDKAARRRRCVSYGKKRSTWDDDRDYEALKGWLDFQRHRDGRKYQTYQVRLRKHPDNGEAAMDMVDKDARRRWYESFLDFLPSTLTDSGEPRLLHCYPPYDFNGFLANLTMDEAWVLANKPGIRRMLPDYGDSYSYSTTSCGFETTANTKRLRRV